MARRKTLRKKAARKSSKKKRAAPSKSLAINKEAHWNAYRELQKRVDRSWAKLRENVQRKAEPKVLIKNRNQLLFLLGECNYMARECARHAVRARRMG